MGWAPARPWQSDDRVWLAVASRYHLCQRCALRCRPPHSPVLEAAGHHNPGAHDGLRIAPYDLAAAGTGVAPHAAHARRLLCCASAIVVLTVSQRKTRFGVGVAQAAVQMPQIPVEPVFAVPSRRCSQPGKACRPGGRGSVGPIAAASSPFGQTALRCRQSQVGKHSR